ncbi:DNA polymerase IV [Nisaea acidiphila]|uniref:DNA polymerase IV n=1 Tax=Nisaea acidiphila TaxID=1862145 RepID=A0A9J7AVV2_9PROT|nr:DNA polymerase IV [Nisaea acidiphila]UUX50930.1 DNA polymerase IV [Nisaea acidiphila]
MTERNAPTRHPALCRDCYSWLEDMPVAETPRCQHCSSPRLSAHAEIRTLSIAHIDCDAFYATVEKRDNPELLSKPVIVGGGKRGVVSAACYVARTYGVRSAMPMFKALKACPHAVVIKPDMQKYSRIGKEIRSLMQSVTPLVEPISIDEAFLDLSGTERLHHAPPAETLCRLVARIETEIGVTASIGLSYNKFLAKVASDLDKPRGFAAIGRSDAIAFLKERPVTTIWGVGKSLHEKLRHDGIETVGHLQGMEEDALVRRYGSIGTRLARFALGRDDRKIEPHSETKSVSCETTFSEDLTTMEALDPILWRLAEELSGRLKTKALSGRTIVLKLKTADFKQISRQVHQPGPTQMADTLYRAGRRLLERELDGRAFRLIGIGVSDLADPDGADLPDLADPGLDRRRKVESAMDAVRAKLGKKAITKGRGFGDRMEKQCVSARLPEEDSDPA